MKSGARDERRSSTLIVKEEGEATCAGDRKVLLLLLGLLNE